MLKRTFGSNREEVARGWRTLHNKELHNLYTSQNIKEIQSRKMRWVGNIACMGEMRNSYQSVAGKPEGKKAAGRPRHGLRILE